MCFVQSSSMKKIWKYWFDTNWKVWKFQNDVYGKSEFMGKRNVKKNEKQREKWEKIKKIRKRKKFGFGGTWATRNV